MASDDATDSDQSVYGRRRRVTTLFSPTRRHRRGRNRLQGRTLVYRYRSIVIVSYTTRTPVLYTARGQVYINERRRRVRARPCVCVRARSPPTTFSVARTCSARLPPLPIGPSRSLVRARPVASISTAAGARPTGFRSLHPRIPIFPRIHTRTPHPVHRSEQNSSSITSIIY